MRYIVQRRHGKIAWLLRALLQQQCELIIDIPPAEAAPFVAENLLVPVPDGEQ